MKASLKAVLHSVTFTEKGAKVVLECSTANALEAARQVSKMTGGSVQADFDDGQDALDLFTPQGVQAMVADIPSSNEPIPFGDGEPNDGLPPFMGGEVIDVPADDDVDEEGIEEID